MKKLMRRSLRNAGVKTAVCFGLMQAFLIMGLSVGLSEKSSAPQSMEQCKPPARELQVRPFRKIGTGKADASLSAINPPDGLAFTGDGLLLATDAMNHRVQIFDPYSGKHLGAAGDPGLLNGEVVDIVTLSDKCFLVSDAKANQIYRFGRSADSPATFKAMGPPILNREGFKHLCGMACDSKKRIYVVDGLSGEVRRYLPDFRPDLNWKFQSTRPDNGRILNRAEGIAIDE